jgi:hypothetical protein
MTTITVKGFTPESFAKELETEQRYSSTTREDFFFFNEDDVEESSIDFQAIYNAASDINILQKYIDRFDIDKNGYYSSEIDRHKSILARWIKGEDVSDISISDFASYTCKVMYFVFIYNRYISSWNARHKFAAFDKWLNKNK